MQDGEYVVADHGEGGYKWDNVRADATVERVVRAALPSNWAAAAAWAARASAPLLAAQSDDTVALRPAAGRSRMQSAAALAQPMALAARRGDVQHHFTRRTVLTVPRVCADQTRQLVLPPIHWRPQG